MVGAESGSTGSEMGKGPVALKTKEMEKVKFGEVALEKSGPLSWYGETNLKATHQSPSVRFEIIVSRKDGRLEMWQRNVHAEIGETDAIVSSAKMFFTQSGKLDEIAHVDHGMIPLRLKYDYEKSEQAYIASKMGLPKVSVLEENMRNFLKNSKVQKILAEVNSHIEERDKRREELGKHL